MIGQNPQEEQVFSVSQITSFVKDVLEATFKNLTIEGEISNYKPSAAGHHYFTLKDSGAQMSAVMFKGATFKLSFKPKDGDKVKCKGSLSVYAQRGSYQLIVTSMEPIGEGNILQMLEQRKQKLLAEGLFDSDKKKPLPKFPKTIGLSYPGTGIAVGFSTSIYSTSISEIAVFNVQHQLTNRCSLYNNGNFQ